MPAPASFFSAVATRKQSMKVRRDAAPLRPDELIALRRMLRRPVLEEYLNSFEVARRLKLSNLTIREMVKRGEFPHAVKPQRNVVRIPLSDVLAWLEANQVQTPALAAPSFLPEEPA